MKNACYLLLILLSAQTCFGQTLFFDNLNGSTWTSSSDISDLTLKSNKKIPLSKLIYPRDSIGKNVTIWTFRDSMLTIVKYDITSKTDSLIGNYKYAHNNMGILKITLQDNTTLEYKVAIVSTGYYAILLRTKQKKEKRQK